MAVQDKLDAEELKQYYNSADGIRLSPGWLGGRDHLCRIFFLPLKITGF